MINSLKCAGAGLALLTLLSAHGGNTPANLGTPVVSSAAPEVRLSAQVGLSGVAGNYLPTGANCKGNSLVTVVAHMDDDLFFVDPSITKLAKQGACIATVFVIGGSSGAGFSVVPVRESGSKAAYARMLGVANQWNTDTLDVNSIKLMRSSLVGVPNVSLVFMRVPGGNVRTGDVPLANVFDNDRATVNSWPYSQASGATNAYTRANLIATVTGLVKGFGATQVYALNPDTLPYIEHPDHIYSARLTREALRGLSQNLPVQYHTTYPTGGMVPNVPPTDVQFKRDLLGAYMEMDGGGASANGIFSEAIYNGNWIARNYSHSTMAWDSTPTVDTPLVPIVNMHSQHCLTSAGLYQAVRLTGCTAGASNQQWRYIPSRVKTGNWGTALIQNKAGNCIAMRSGAVVEEVCNSSDSNQLWQPWDFGKLYNNAHACMIESNLSLKAGNCSTGYPELALWSNQITTVDSDLNAEVALVGDVSGTGSEKLVQVHRRNDGPGINVWVSTLTAGASTLSSQKWFDGVVAFKPTASTPTCNDTTLCFDQSRFLLADFNGDGKADLMVVTANSHGTAFWLMASNGQSFAAPVLWAQTNDLNYNNAHQYLVGDFNGDGRPDVLIADTRSDSGLNFWVLTNTGNKTLAAPTLWAQAAGLQNKARLFTAKLDSTPRFGVLAIDEIGGLRISSFSSNGSAFVTSMGARGDNLFDPTRSKVVVTQTWASALSDVWVLHARADGTAINFWQLNGKGNGQFSAPSLQQTVSALAWSDARPYVQRNVQGNQLLLVHRVDNNVGEFAWRTGVVGVKGLSFTSTGLSTSLTNYGSNTNFLWTNMAWRNRLNR